MKRRSRRRQQEKKRKKEHKKKKIIFDLPFLLFVKNFFILSKGDGAFNSSFIFFCILSYSSRIAVSCRCLSLKLCWTSFRLRQFSTSLSTSDIVKTLFLKSVIISSSSSCGPEGSRDFGPEFVVALERLEAQPEVGVVTPSSRLKPEDSKRVDWLVWTWERRHVIETVWGAVDDEVNEPCVLGPER